MKKNIAVLTGGFEAERVISIQSARLVMNNLKNLNYNCYLIDIQDSKWVELDSNSQVDLNDFTINDDENEKIKFDACFMAVHGSPVEDGMIQGYFDILQIPYTGAEGKVMAITMDKILTKQIVECVYGIKTPKFKIYRTENDLDIKSIEEEMGYPMFIKPNSVGSSFGVTKVKKREDIIPAIESALEHDNTVIIEEFIEGREFAQGVLQEGDKLHILPITEIIPENEFFDYEAKYEGKSQEITPAENLNSSLQEEMSFITKQIFQVMGCKDMARVDYILRDEELFFMEVNTIPGLSKMSIYPQQLKAYGIDLSKAFDIMISNNIKT